ncbi:MAG TPA: SRPBCC domain-containing protein [Candidatus Eremiobacteraceae bacterium]|nr:SRPBCC domain-containing protein [Candidatus Eremiobacteraceae bacterium]
MQQQPLGAASVRSIADTARGELLATVDIAAPPERVFRALCSNEITRWWVRDGVFDTRTWEGEVKSGGRWRAAGVARGEAYVLEGEFLEVSAPRRLVHSWHLAGMGLPTTTVRYALEPIDGGTRITLRHTGFSNTDVCEQTSIGWETSFRALAALLAPATV